MRYAIAAAFVSGFSVMGLEMSLARLVAPHFGASMPVWALLISLVLVTMSAGYLWGGRLGPRRDPRRACGAILVASGAAIACLALFGAFLLRTAAGTGHGAPIAARAPCLGLAAILSGAAAAGLCAVVPLCVRQGVGEGGEPGAMAGRASGAATAGSLLGTLLTAFVALPAIGTRATLLALAAPCVILGGLGMRRMGPALLALAPFALLPLAAGSWLDPPKGGDVLFSGESLCHHVEVRRRPGGSRELFLDARLAVQSLYDPRGPSARGSWPLFLAASDLRADCARPPRSALILGYGAGTLARDLRFAFPGIRIDGAEVDSELPRLGRLLFGAPPDATVFAGDGRVALGRGTGKYDLVFIDAYRDMYVPFHLATREFFGAVAGRLSGSGVVAANVLGWNEEQTLLEAVGATMSASFDRVALLRARPSLNALLLAWNGAPLDSLLSRRCAKPSHPVQARLLAAERRRLEAFAPAAGARVLTDDLAPVELFTHEIVAAMLLGRVDQDRARAAEGRPGR